MSDKPGNSDVDDFNAHRFLLKLETIPKILEGQLITIPIFLNFKNEPEPFLCNSCIPAYGHSCFIINGKFILKRESAISQARRIKWGK